MCVTYGTTLGIYSAFLPLLYHTVLYIINVPTADEELSLFFLLAAWGAGLDWTRRIENLGGIIISEQTRQAPSGWH